jgi:hypothetical protein
MNRGGVYSSTGGMLNDRSQLRSGSSDWAGGAAIAVRYMVRS